MTPVHSAANLAVGSAWRSPPPNIEATVCRLPGREMYMPTYVGARDPDLAACYRTAEFRAIFNWRGRRYVATVERGRIARIVKHSLVCIDT